MSELIVSVYAVVCGDIIRMKGYNLGSARKGCVIMSRDSEDLVELFKGICCIIVGSINAVILNGKLERTKEGHASRTVGHCMSKVAECALKNVRSR